MLDHDPTLNLEAATKHYVDQAVTGTITGSGTNGYLTKWSGSSSITNGPQLGSDATKFLNNAGNWAVPTGTTYSASTGLTLSGTAFSLNTASTSALGGIKVGEGLAINSGNGLLSIDSTGADEGDYLRRGPDGFEWGIPGTDLYLPLTGGTITALASYGGTGSSARAPLVIDCSAMSSGAWTEGIRIKPAASGWTSFMLCGTDNTTNINSSANSWSMHTYQGKFGIYRNGSDIATSTMLMGIECSSTGLWKIKSNNTDITGTLTLTNTAANANPHVLADLLAPNLSAGSTGTYSTTFIRFGVGLSMHNSAGLTFHYVGSSNSTNYMGLGLYGNDYIMVVNGQQRVGIKNTAPISELDVAGGISWSSKATSQYNATDDCVEFIFV